MTNVAEITRARQTSAAEAIYRAATAAVAANVRPRGDDEYFERRSADEVSRIIYKAATGPGTVAGSGWAAELAQTAVAEFLTGLGTISAGSQLLAESLIVPFPGSQGRASVPSVVPPDSVGGFVEEGQPIRVASFGWTAETLARKKLALISVISRELAKSSQAESEVRRVMQESAARVLDGVLFGDAAATDAAPAGLLYGVTPTGDLGFDSDPLVNDLTGLASVVSPIAGNRIAYAASPARAAQISMRMPGLRYPVFPSAAIPDTRIIAVALNGLAVAVDPTPDILVSNEALLHMSDVPLEIVASGSPDVTADPVRSVFQTAALAIRLIVDANWTLRDPRAVAFVDGAAW